MELSSACMACLVRREEEKLRSQSDRKKCAEYMREVLRLIANSEKEANSPLIVSELEKLYKSFFGEKFSREADKRRFNELMLGMMDSIRRRIESAPDPILCALKYARAGNYIDFGATQNVEIRTLEELLASAESEHIEEIEYKSFLSELDNARRMVYITDNCGEVVLDMLLIEQLQKRLPQLQITALVRGDDAINDVTVEDAEEVGLTGLVSVVGNGTSIAGTQIYRISAEARALLESADLILAKGQGNFETMYFSGLPVYYAFLCKCPQFTRSFGLPVNTGVFKREDRIKI